MKKREIERNSELKFSSPKSVPLKGVASWEEGVARFWGISETTISF